MLWLGLKKNGTCCPMTGNTRLKTLRNSKYWLWNGLCKTKMHDEFFTPPQIPKQIVLNEFEKATTPSF